MHELRPINVALPTLGRQIAETMNMLPEDIAPETGELWNNFPQTCSMVGIVVAVMRLSEGWESAR